MIKNFAAHMDTALELLIPTNTKLNGVPTKVYPSSGDVVFANFKRVGGSESKNDDLLLVRDTATLRMWADKRVDDNCRFKVVEDGTIWEILHVEFVDMRNQQMVVKVERVVGGA